MIKKVIKRIKKVFIPKSEFGDDITVNMDGGVGGSWEVKSESDFETIWKEMDEIDPLTPVTQSQRKD